MKKNMLFIFMSLVSVSTFALEPLSDQELQSVEGQAGADLSLKLSLNQKGDGSFDSTLCANVEYCRLAMSLNKRFVSQKAGDVNNIFSDANSDSGHKLWLVFKGIQGTINIQKLGIDGADLTYKNDSGTQIIKPAIQLSTTASIPIQVRNFGFNALSIEQDSFNSTSTTEGVGANASDYGYLKTSTYSSTNASVYDRNKETGFTGMMMNGNIALNGKVMVFSCDASHPRC
ncbi:hypothetical protein [Acinetobacter sp. P8-3-8]|uniref:hypothetical protein n=1 Tax=Acinetobacter sp. P8-3-8 TaxID=1029823 RepID=UPI0002487AE1|nr:hypothetical protein [Acinetobacter sp. P8-3-8]